jgi:purine-binding chemotaxis protein CheW
MPDLLPLDAAIRSFCTFRLDRRLYGFEVAQVREISPLLPLTPVPQTPPAIRGLFNLRSRIYLGLDLRPLLGLAPTPCTPECQIIILPPGVAPDVGVLVEQGGDIVHVPANLIDSARDGAEAPRDDAASLIAGVCRLPAELMLVVDITRIIELVTRLIR